MLDWSEALKKSIGCSPDTACSSEEFCRHQQHRPAAKLPVVQRGFASTIRR